MRKKHPGIITKIIVMFFIIYATVTLISLQSQISEAEAEVAALEESVAAKAASNAALEYDIAHSGDRETLEDIARKKLGLVLPGERVFYDVTN